MIERRGPPVKGRSAPDSNLRMPDLGGSNSVAA